MSMKRGEMRGVTITDATATGSLAFDLREILDLIPENLLDSTWNLEGVEAIGGAASAELNAASDRSTVLDGTRLYQLARSVTQIVDGTFRAFDGPDEEPWLVVRAVDSAAFDVITSSPELLAALRRRFRSVSDYPVEEAAAEARRPRGGTRT